MASTQLALGGIDMSNEEMNNLEEPIFDDVSIYDIMFGPRVEPHDRITLFSPDQYEKFTKSWLSGCRKSLYRNIGVYGGSGDKGRDVVGYYLDGSWDNYQCKRYITALSPSVIKLEVGKIIYYSYNGDYIAPKNHYFVSPKGLSSNSRDLLMNQKTLKSTMIDEWDKVCKESITDTMKIPLTEKLKEYIEAFDFSIFSYVDSNQMIDDLHGTKFFARFFGGGFSQPRNDELVVPPEKVDESENKYIKCLLDAYGDYYGDRIDDLTILESNFPREYKHFKKQRQYFYTAEALRKYSIESLPIQRTDARTHFDKLKDEYLCVIQDILDEDFDNGYECVKEVIKEVAKVSCDNSILKYEIGAQDKKGICHHLSNDGKVTWVSEDE